MEVETLGCLALPCFLGNHATETCIYFDEGKFEDFLASGVGVVLVFGASEQILAVEDDVNVAGGELPRCKVLLKPLLRRQKCLLFVLLRRRDNIIHSLTFFLCRFGSQYVPHLGCFRHHFLSLLVSLPVHRSFLMVLHKFRVVVACLDLPVS